MISDDERRKRFNQMREREALGPDSCWWLSFADPDKPKGQQFLGVVIVRAPGFVSAIELANSLGLNPWGAVRGEEIDPTDIAPEHFNRLLSQKELVDAGYCEAPVHYQS
jgi:hypothetical protein